MKFIIALIFSLFWAVVPGSSAWAQSGNCALETDTVLKLSGSTDAEMLACVQSKTLGNVKIIKVNSPGGSVRDALKIGDLLAPLDAEFIITKQCSSSCANYFLPIARKITLQKNTGIFLHGSIDPGTTRKAIQDGLGDKSVKLWDTVERQQRYAEKYDIHRGWLLYRHSFENGGGARFDYVNGEIGWRGKSRTVRAILVEERMLRSCLKNVEITPFVDTLIDRAHASKKKRRKLTKQEVSSSGTWECIGPGSAHLPTPDFTALRAEVKQPEAKP